MPRGRVAVSSSLVPSSALGPQPCSYSRQYGNTLAVCQLSWGKFVGDSLLATQKLLSAAGNAALKQNYCVSNSLQAPLRCSFSSEQINLLAFLCLEAPHGDNH